MRIFILMFCMISVSLSDEITLKTGFTIRAVDILEIDASAVVYRAEDGTVVKVPLRDVDLITQSHDPLPATIILRDGSTVEGTIDTLDHSSVTIRTAAGDTAVIEPSNALRIEGPAPALSFRTSDGRYMFLARSSIRFVGGKPQKPFEESRYRVIFSALSALPASSSQFSFPGILSGTLRSGYGMSFTIDFMLNELNAFSFSYRFTENGLNGPDSLGAPVSDWSNHVLLGGIKRYVPLGDGITLYGEAKMGYLYSTPPEYHSLLSGQAGGSALSVGAGIYFAEQISLDVTYLSSSPIIPTTYSSRNSFPSVSSSILARQNISLLLVGLSYTIGSDQ
jgi:hypothetical protein